MPDFPKRRIGQTHLEVSVLGCGGAALGNLYTPVAEAAAQATLEASWDAGIRYFDTAPFYGYGLSERRFGDALRRQPRDSYVLSTKVGRLLAPRGDPVPDDDAFPGSLPFLPVYDYSYDAVRRSFEDSLQRLGLDRIDILLIHDIGPVTHGVEAHPAMMKICMEGGYKALAELREQGMIGALGMGVNEWEVCAEALSHHDFDCFLLAGRYTLLEQTALDSFLPECERRNVSIIVGGPYNSGILVTGAQPGAWYNYAPAPAEILQKVGQIEAVCQAHQVPLAAAALKFPLTHPAIACVIPGGRNGDEVRRNVELMQTTIPSSLWSDLKNSGLMHPQAPTPAD